MFNRRKLVRWRMERYRGRKRRIKKLARCYDLDLLQAITWILSSLGDC